MALPRHRQERLRGGDVHHACPRFLQEPVARLHHVDRAHQVDLDHAAKGVGGHAVEARREIARSPRDQHVEIAPGGVHLAQGPASMAAISRTSAENPIASAPSAFERSDGVVDLVLRPAGHGHARAMAGEQLRDAAIDAAGAADDDHGLAGEIDVMLMSEGPPACLSLARHVRPARPRGTIAKHGPDATLYAAPEQDSKLTPPNRPVHDRRRRVGQDAP
jgi:hypothetical protein